ncbi:TetR/AcrR family transcriptional regulator [Nocardioides seonyuensis]|nr:TetR/AcrR family transcriptional regulator [Nocardioides seonyuensis]
MSTTTEESDETAGTSGQGDMPPLADVTALKTPTTPRGARTRAALVAAARVVFERDGYLEARLTDITAEAHCSTGSFYTYFTNKEEILQAVIEGAQNDMLNPGMPRLSEEESSPEAIIRASNRAYFEAYRRNAKLMMILEQVAAIDPKFREVRRRRSQAFAHRNAKGIAALQEQGLVDTDLDAVLASLALSSMVSRMAYHTFCLGDEVPMDDLVETCTRLWVNALQMAPEGRDA